MTQETRRQIHQHQKKLTQRKVVKRDSSSTIDNSANCLAGGLYIGPVSGQQVSVINATDIKWNSTCLDSTTSKIDIYVYSPSEEDQALPIHVFQGIPANQALYTTKLDPRWWGRDLKSNSTVDVSFNIVPSGNEPWDSSNPMGPTFTANYVVPATGESEAAKIFGKLTNSVKTAFFEAGQLTAAGKTAAIICPIVIVAVGLGMLIRRLHIKRQNKTVDWAENMDKRMSRVSIDWTRGGDGSAGPLPGTRPASYVQRASQDVYGGNFAGRGAARVPRQMEDITNAYSNDNEMREAMPRGMSMYEEGNRSSRISFAGQTRGDRVSRISYAASGEGRPSGTFMPGSRSRSQMVDSYYDPDAPPMPQIGSHDNTVHADGGPDDDMLMSPTQNDGPRPLGLGDVDRMHNNLTSSASNGVDMFAAMTDDRRLSETESYVDPEHYTGQNGMAPPTNISPDEAMKNYASLRTAGAPQASLQTSSSQFGGMRSLYTPNSGLNLHSSVTGSSLNEEEVVGYNEMIDHGNDSH